MAATLKNLQSALRGKERLEAARNRPKKFSPEGIELARKILDNYRLPTTEDPTEDEATK